jgi:basic amino acid/polyamine antiporter, APA family
MAALLESQGVPPLARTITSRQLFALAFGTIIGSAWAVVLGHWLAAAGPVGATIGFVGGGLIMLIVALSYAELSARVPVAGAEASFAKAMFGPAAGFAVGWFIVVQLVTVTTYEAISMSWILSMLLPAIKGSELYSVLGYAVTADMLAVGAGSTLFLTVLNCRGVHNVVAVQSVLTVTFLAIALVAIVSGFLQGSPAKLSPLFATRDNPWWFGAAWIFATSSFWYAGFQAISQTIEERHPSIGFRRIAWLMGGAIVFAIIFYCAVIWSAALSTPWQDLDTEQVGAAAAFGALPLGHILAPAILLAAFLSLLKMWNGTIVMASRMLLALARAGYLPPLLARVHPETRAPHISVLLIGAFTIVTLPLGKGVIVPVINMAAMCAGVVIVILLLGLLRMRLTATTTPDFQVPGGTYVIALGIAGSGAMAVFALVEPWVSGRGEVPIEWLLVTLWGALGFVCWRRLGARAQSPAVVPATTTD